MPALDVATEYVRLGLRFDRLESGFVDAYTGDPQLRAAVADEPAPTPAQLASRRATCCAELDSSELRGRAGRLPARSADRPGVHRPEDGGRTDRIRRRGGRLLPGRRRPRRRGRVRGRARRARPAAPRRRLARRALRRPPPPRGVPSAASGGRGARPLQCAARPRAWAVRAARGRDRALRGGHRPAVVRVQLLRGRVPFAGGDQRRPAAPAEQPAAPGGPRGLSGAPHRALPQGTRAGRASLPHRAHGLPRQHSRVPDGRGPGRSRDPGLRSGRGGAHGRRRSSATWDCASTGTSPNGSPPRRPP